MSIRSKLEVVGIAEADCALRRATVGAAWRGLKLEAERAATPGRMLGAGLIAGFISGLRKPASGSGSALGGKLFGLLIDGAFASFSAAMAAGAAAADVNRNATATDPQSSAGND